jgi:chromosome segregation ATPase
VSGTDRELPRQSTDLTALAQRAERAEAEVVRLTNNLTLAYAEVSNLQRELQNARADREALERRNDELLQRLVALEEAARAEE